jgi:membrane-associated phospholipid phosphatase
MRLRAVANGERQEGTQAAGRGLRRASGALLALLLALPLPARADWTQAAPTDALALRPAADVALTAGGFAFWLGTELAKSKLAPAGCHVCDGPDNSGLPGDPQDGQGSLNPVDAWFHDALTGALWSRKTSSTISNYLAFGLAPAGALASALFATGAGQSDGAGLRSALVVAESLAVAGTLVQSTKFLVARQRPYVRYGHATDGATAAEGSTYDETDPDSHLGFPSGHTAATAAVTFSAAMTATLQDSPAAPYLWVAAGVLTASAGTLRMMSENHYFTDVLGGALIGAASGVVIPLLHRRGSALAGASGLSFGAGSGGTVIALSGTF